MAGLFTGFDIGLVWTLASGMWLIDVIRISLLTFFWAKCLSAGQACCQATSYICHMPAILTLTRVMGSSSPVLHPSSSPGLSQARVSGWHLDVRGLSPCHWPILRAQVAGWKLRAVLLWGPKNGRDHETRLFWWSLLGEMGAYSC